MPDVFYYANNGKSASENYVEIYRQNQIRVRELLSKRSEEQQSRREAKELAKDIDTQIEKEIDKLLDDTFGKFSKK